jgi:hypothetical protein
LQQVAVVKFGCRLPHWGIALGRGFSRELDLCFSDKLMSDQHWAKESLTPFL